MSQPRRQGTSDEVRHPPTKKVAGFPMGAGHEFRGAAGLERDYEQLLPDTDKMYHECDADARVWHVYNEESDQIDREMLVQSGDALDASLIFGALFSGVITTFVSQTSTLLPRDNSALTVDVLVELSHLIRAQINGTDPTTIPPVNTNPSPDATNIVWVNGLWFTSLVLSLATALFAVLAKQWLRHYASPIRSSAPRERAVIHRYRLLGFEAWGVPTIIGLLPTFLHISLLLFLGGLFLYLVDLHPVLSRAVGSLSLAVAAIYIFFLVMPVFFINCPYQVAFTDILKYSLQTLYKAGIFVSAGTLVIVMFCLHSFVHLVKITVQILRRRRNSAEISWWALIDSHSATFYFRIFIAFVDSLSLWSRWTDMERRAANLDEGLILSAIRWLCVATPNISAQRIAWQSCTAIRHLTASQRDDFAVLWYQTYARQIPSLNRGAYSQEELFRQAERWFRSWLYLRFSPPRATDDLSRALSRSSEVAHRLAENTAGMSWLFERTSEPAVLLAILYNWTPKMVGYRFSRRELDRLLPGLDLPSPGAQPFVESLHFLDFVTHSANLAHTETRLNDEDRITLEEALHDQLKEKGWFEDPRIVQRVAKLQEQPAHADSVPPSPPSSSPRPVSPVIDDVATLPPLSIPSSAPAPSSASIPPQNQAYYQNDLEQHEQIYPPRPAPPADDTVRGFEQAGGPDATVHDFPEPARNRAGHWTVEFEAESSSTPQT